MILVSRTTFWGSRYQMVPFILYLTVLKSLIFEKHEIGHFLAYQ